jgi:hypothetical protein
MSTAPLMPSTDELVQFITYTGESENIDAKCPMKWDGAEASAGLAKDVAAFANSRDGGVLVIGKEEVSPGNFVWHGLTEEQAASFDTTKVATWINNYFAPPLRLVCHRQEHNGKMFIVITVAEFDDVPAMCVRPFFDPRNPKKSLLKEKTIYVRNANAESSPLGSVEELRSLIGLATRKRGDELLTTFHAMLKGKPLVPPPTHDEEFAEQLDEVNSAITPQGWKGTAGEWLFYFHPSVYDPDRWPELAQLESLVFHRSVRMRHEFPPSYKGTHPREWGIANDLYGEPWALTRAGLFVYHRPFRENEVPFQSRFRDNTGKPILEVPAGEWIEFEWNMDVIIQCFMFLSRMADVFGPDATIVYQFRAAPLRGRKLVTLNPDIRIGYADDPSPCRASEYDRSRALTVGELRANWRDECAEAMKRFFELFPEHDIQLETLRKWVDRFEQRGVEERSNVWKKVR